MKVKELFEATKERSILSIMGALDSDYTGVFNVNSRSLTSLKGSPKNVIGSYECDNNKLTSLTGGPVKVDGLFDCSVNPLVSLEGAPAHITASFYCSDTSLTSLKGIHKHIKYIGQNAVFSHSPINSHVLGVLKINGLKSVSLSNSPVAKILNKHLKGDRDIFACQEELIEAGFPQFAQL